MSNASRCRTYYERNREAIKERYVANIDSIKAYQAAYRAANKGKPKKKYANKKKYGPYPKRELSELELIARNARAKDYAKANKHKSLARTVGHNKELIHTLLLIQSYKCPYCGCDISENYSMDHMTPKSRGGTDDRTNLQLTCWPCNARKCTSTHEEYLVSLNWDDNNEIDIKSFSEIIGLNLDLPSQ